jgi:hypothetical protein
VFASNAIAQPTVSQMSYLRPLSTLGALTRNGVGSTGSDEMGDELAYFKTIRLCSITAALSNTIAVVIIRIARSARHRRNAGAGRAKWGAAGAHSCGKGMRNCR